MVVRHVLLEKRTRKIVADATSKSAIVKKAQPIINRNPRKQYRYAVLNVDRHMPWFKKGE